jgi:hypothetical protein
MVSGPGDDMVDDPLAHLRLSGLTVGASYHARWVDPRTGQDEGTFSFRADDGGGYPLVAPLSFLGIPLSRSRRARTGC